MAESKSDKAIDIKGLVCPMTFVRAKLAIEMLESGQVLEVLLDYEEASSSVPKSMQEQGHEVLSIDKINETDWVVLIRKGAE